MTNNKKKLSFSGRAFVSSLTLFATAGLIFSGAILFVTPPGRVANWTGWRLIGLTKHEWVSVHILLALLFVIAAVFHIYLNWRPMIGYFKSRLNRANPLRPEWIAALALSLLIVFGALYQWPLFASVMAWNESLKGQWEQRQTRRAPIPHAELLTLTELAEATKADLDAMKANLKSAGIEVTSDTTRVADLAEQYDKTPAQIFSIATSAMETTAGRPGRGQGQGQGMSGQGQGRGGGGQGQGQGGGRGAMTLGEICQQDGMDIANALATLKAAGIEDATADMTLREIARSHNMRPPDLMDILGVRP